MVSGKNFEWLGGYTDASDFVVPFFVFFSDKSFSLFLSFSY